MKFIRRFLYLRKYDRAMIGLMRAGKYLLTQRPDDVEANLLCLNTLQEMLERRASL